MQELEQMVNAMINSLELLLATAKKNPHMTPKVTVNGWLG